MDFVADQLADGRKLRALTVLDVFTREALCIRVAQRLRGEDVVDACSRLVAQRGAPARVFVDNGSEFSDRLMDLWAYHHGVQIDFSAVPASQRVTVSSKPLTDRSAMNA